MKIHTKKPKKTKRINTGVSTNRVIHSAHLGSNDVIFPLWQETKGKPPKYHEAVLDLYFRSAREAYSVLKTEGIYMTLLKNSVRVHATYYM